MNMEEKIFKAGPFLGREEGGIAVFKGIRYASAKRFEPAELCELPSTETDASRFGACCPQKRAYVDEGSLQNKQFYYNEFRKGVKFSYDEDCLFLNVYAPKEGKNMPVIVFVHGGSFVSGSADEKQFYGAAYAKKGVIFVTINYRLGVFGNFAAEGRAQNLCISDVLAALSWVRKNIGIFGGYGDNITLMGQSAGAMIAQTVLSFDLAKGVKRGIMLSGGGDRKLLLPLKKPNFRFWQGVMRKAGADSVEEFAAMDAKRVFEAYSSSSGIGALFATAPVIDGKLIVKARHDPPKVECIFGTVQKDLLPPVLRHMKRAMAKRMAKAGVKAYLYEFSHSLPEDGGTFHSADLWYAIGSLRASDRPMKKRDFDIADEMTSRFAAFAKGDSPNIGGYEVWSPYLTRSDELKIR